MRISHFVYTARARRNAQGAFACAGAVARGTIKQSGSGLSEQNHWQPAAKLFIGALIMKDDL
jgi:hypothetical protein